MDVIIRKAREEDVPRMLELVKELALFERAPEEVTVTVEAMRDAGFGPEATWYGWVAENTEGQHAIVGLAICYTRYSTWKGNTLYLEDFVVTESARSAGVGLKLFKVCCEYAVEKNFPLMIWQVLDWNVDAIRFYERHGASIDSEWLEGRMTLEGMKKLVD